MALGSAFSTSVLALMSQSHAMENISQNIANVNTNGYKRSESLFKTQLAQVNTQYNSLGVQTADRSLVDRQGSFSSTGEALDIAISGSGLFVLNSDPSGNGTTVYTRNGSFEPYQIGDQVYLTVNGYFLMGEVAGGNAMAPVTISLNEADEYGNYYGRSIPGSATTLATLVGNLDATAITEQTMGFPAYDADGVKQTLTMTWTPTNTPNVWDLTITDNAGNTNIVSQQVTFDAKGNIVSPTELSITADWGTAGGTSTFTLDLTSITSMGGETMVSTYNIDGTPPGSMTSYAFNTRGELIAQYSNGQSEILGRIPVAVFSSPNNLQLLSNTVFGETLESGGPTYTYLGEAGSDQVFIAGAVELSNVDMATEFTNMIMAQRAYSTAGKVFSTVDEMMQLVYGMKS